MTIILRSLGPAAARIFEDRASDAAVASPAHPS